MARKLLLDAEATRLLRTRVYLSQSVHLFSLQEIGSNWIIGIRTIHRYSSDQDRENSREYSRKAYFMRRQREPRGECHSCHDSLQGHARCPQCTILLHNGNETCEASYCIGREIQAKMDRNENLYIEATY